VVLVMITGCRFDSFGVSTIHNSRPDVRRDTAAPSSDRRADRPPGGDGFGQVDRSPLHREAGPDSTARRRCASPANWLPCASSAPECTAECYDHGETWTILCKPQECTCAAPDGNTYVCAQVGGNSCDRCETAKLGCCNL
jgi:hypothetical protein